MFHSRRQTSLAPSQARKLPYSRKSLRVDDRRDCVSIGLAHLVDAAAPVCSFKQVQDMSPPLFKRCFSLFEEVCRW
jgi:hypothetical protein